jgi:hypothetical protein
VVIEPTGKQPKILVEHLAQKFEYLAAISQIPTKHPKFLLINSHQQVDCTLKKGTKIKNKCCLFAWL